MPLPINVVPVEAVGDEFALLPVRLQFFVPLTTSDAHWAIAEDLLRQKKKHLFLVFIDKEILLVLTVKTLKLLLQMNWHKWLLGSWVITATMCQI